MLSTWLARLVVIIFPGSPAGICIILIGYVLLFDGVCPRTWLPAIISLLDTNDGDTLLPYFVKEIEKIDWIYWWRFSVIVISLKGLKCVVFNILIWLLKFLMWGQLKLPIFIKNSVFEKIGKKITRYLLLNKHNNTEINIKKENDNI